MKLIDKSWLNGFAELVGENVGKFRRNVSDLLSETADALGEKARAIEKAASAGRDAYNKVSDKREKKDSEVFSDEPQPNDKETIVTEQKTCIGYRCQSPAAPDNSYCYEHFFETEAQLRAASLRNSHAQNATRSKSLTCVRPTCTKRRSPESDLCSQHLIEFGMYKQRQCGKKKRHHTHQDADDHLRGLAHVERKPPEAFTIYSCEFCNTYHVGHKKIV